MATGKAESVAEQPEALHAQPDIVGLQERIEQLEAENTELKKSVTVSGPSTRGRNAGAVSLAVVAALLLALSVPAVWLNRIVTDTDVYVATVAPLAQDPDIQNAVATAASDAVIERVDAQSRIKQLLPENLQIIATPVSQAVNDFIAKQAFVLVRSERFATTWEAVNRASHKALVAAVTGRDTGAVGVKAGTITLDVGVLAEELKTRLTAAGLGFAANIPTSAVDRQIVLYESPLLAQLTSAIDMITRIALWLPLLGIGLAAAAVALAADRRKAVLWLGGALAVAALLPLQALYFGQGVVIKQLYELASIPSPAAQAAFAIIFRDLVTVDRAAIALGSVIWVGAVIAGPARWAVALREGLSGGLSGVASHLELGRFGLWVRARKGALRTGGIAGALVILALLPAPRTVGSVVWLAIAYATWILLVELFGAEVPPPDETAGLQPHVQDEGSSEPSVEA